MDPNRKNMNAKKSLVFLLRVFFVTYSILLTMGAVSIWSALSSFVRFQDFLPYLSLAFLLWTTMEALFVSILWVIIFGLYKNLPKSLIPTRLEHIMAVVVVTVLLTTTFDHMNLHRLFDLTRHYNLIFSLLLASTIILLVRKHIDKIISMFDNGISLLVYFFVVLLILTLPFSVFNVFKNVPRNAELTSNTVHDFSKITRNKKSPNIILIIMDALTTLDMHVFGYERLTTPFISEWTKDAVTFNTAYSSSNVSTPSSMSILTGQRVWTHQVWYDAYYSPLKRHINNLPKHLNKYGYSNYSFVQNHFSHPDALGMDESFITKDKAVTLRILTDSPVINKVIIFFMDRPVLREFIRLLPFNIETNFKKFLQRKKQLRKTVINKTNEAPDIKEEVYKHFLNYISLPAHKAKTDRTKETSLKEPFFVYIHTLLPHDPYLPPKPYIGLFGNADIFDSYKEQQMMYGEYKHEEQIKMDILRKRYDENILYADQQLQLFLSRLANIVDLSNTIIILTADHGESFTHGYWGHAGPHLYEPLVRIPLIIKLPCVHDGKMVNISVEQTDIAPTILDLAGIPVPSWMEGRSLLPLIQGKNIEPRSIFSMQFEGNRSFGHPITKGTVAVRDGDYKLIHYLEDGKSLLFNLRLDPEETKNIFNENPDVSQKLIKLINDNLALANSRITKGTL